MSCISTERSVTVLVLKQVVEYLSEKIALIRRAPAGYNKVSSTGLLQILCLGPVSCVGIPTSTI